LKQPKVASPPLDESWARSGKKLQLLLNIWPGFFYLIDAKNPLNKRMTSRTSQELYLLSRV